MIIFYYDARFFLFKMVINSLNTDFFGVGMYTTAQALVYVSLCPGHELSDTVYVSKSLLRNIRPRDMNKLDSQ